MTPAINLLEKQKIPFQLLSYEHDANNHNFGAEAVEKLALNEAQVFKTLVLETNELHLIVAVTPVNQLVNLKSLAKVVGCKKVHMAEPQKVENSTGYILGGVSPLGQKRRLKTFIHQSALQCEIVYVSAGKRGLEIALTPQALSQLTNGEFSYF